MRLKMRTDEDFQYSNEVYGCQNPRNYPHQRMPEARHRKPKPTVSYRFRSRRQYIEHAHILSRIGQAPLLLHPCLPQGGKAAGLGTVDLGELLLEGTRRLGLVDYEA